MEALYLLGLAYHEMQSYDKSNEYYNKAIEYGRTVLGLECWKCYIGIGRNYYNIQNYQKAAEYFRKAVQINQDESLEDNLVFAADMLETARERGVKLHKVTPGILVLFLGVSEIELGETLPFWIVLLNTSGKRVLVEAETDYSGELGGDRNVKFERELLPGQFDSIKFYVDTTSKTKLKEYDIYVVIKSKTLALSVARKGVEIASGIASKIVPYSGIIVGLAAKLAMKDELALRRKLKVKKPIPKVTCKLKVGDEAMDLTLKYVLDDEKVLPWKYKDKLVKAVKSNEHYALAGDLERIVIGEKSYSDAFLLILASFKKPQENLSQSYKLLLMFREDNKIQLLAAESKYITKEEFEKVMNFIVEKPETLEYVYLFI